MRGESIENDDESDLMAVYFVRQRRAGIMCEMRIAGVHA